MFRGHYTVLTRLSERFGHCEYAGAGRLLLTLLGSAAGVLVACVMSLVGVVIRPTGFLYAVTLSDLQELMEQFPLECINDPVAVRDKNGVFNNIVLFTVVEDPKKRQSPSEMHIFRVVDRSVSTSKSSPCLFSPSMHLSLLLCRYRGPYRCDCGVRVNL